MGNENRAGGDAKDQRRHIRGAVSHGAFLFAPISLFLSIYLATFTLAALWRAAPRYWVALFAAVVATAGTRALVDGGRYPIGLAGPVPRAIAELFGGLAFAVVLVAIADRCIASSTVLRRQRGAGFPWTELALVFLPAAIHEEVVFRGYVFQKLHEWRRAAAFFFSSVVFAGLHAWNRGLTPVAVLNLLIAGVLLGLAFERWGRLWLPIGIHIGWNVVSGPFLGYAVSGHISRQSVWSTTVAGPDWISGGAFGIEASPWVAIVELIGVAALLFTPRRRPL